MKKQPAKILDKTEFGNPILRKKARQLSVDEIRSQKIQNLISSIRYTLAKKKYGIGLAAPQVGQNLSLSVIRIRPNKTRPNLPTEKWADLVIINPKIKRTYGQEKQMWEGCISLPGVFAKVPRFKKIKLEYLDKNGQKRTEDFQGLLAHVIQHETDHLNAKLYVERVKDLKTFMSDAEYRKRIVPNTEPE